MSTPAPNAAAEPPSAAAAVVAVGSPLPSSGIAALPAAATAMDINSTATSPFITSTSAAVSSAAPLLTNDAQCLLNDFFQDETVAAHLRTARHSYLDANRAVKEARSGLARFEAVCHRAAPKLELPKSMRIPWTKNAVLSDPSDAPGLLQDERAALALIEADCTKRAFDVLCLAKRKVISQLETHIIVNTHVGKHTSMFSKYVREYAAKVEARLRPAAAASSAMPSVSSVFPVSVAIARFTDTLRQDTNAIVRRLTNEEMRQDSESAATAALDSKAQEQVLAGAHSGTTIKRLAEQVIRKRLQPLSAAVAQLQNSSSRSSDSSTVRSSSSTLHAIASSETGAHDVDARPPVKAFRRTSNHRMTASPEFQLDPVFTASSSLPRRASDGRKRPAPEQLSSDDDAAESSSSSSLYAYGAPLRARSSNRQGGHPHARSLPRQQSSSDPEDPFKRRDSGKRNKHEQ